MPFQPVDTQVDFIAQEHTLLTTHAPSPRPGGG